MSTRPKPEHVDRSTTQAGAETDPTPEEEEARLQRLIAEGALLPPKDPGGILEELLSPGPTCPGVVQAVLDDRRSRP